ncbi:MAG: ATP-binding protein, partial [Eubacteriales bacterium]|nr:ATP-binding protein [Eubacteriales bacterium]
MENLFYDREIALYLPDFGGAYRVYLDGRLAADSGKLSKNRDEIFTVPKPELYPLMLSSSKNHEVVIEVATTRFSGLYMTPVIDDYQNTISSSNNRNTAELIMFGIAIFSFLALIAMYAALIRRRVLSFWLPIMLFSIIFRIMLTSEFYSFWQPVFFFNAPYEATNELMYFTTFLLKYLLIYLVQEQCGITFNRREKVGFLIYYAVLYCVYLFSPQSFYNDYLSVLVPMLTYVLEFYLVMKIYRGRQTMKRFGLVVFWGAMFVVVGLTIDSYYLNGKIYMDMALTLLTCLTIFTLIMSWMYAMRFGDLYDDFAISSSRLEMANNQIEMQKEY